MASQWLKARQTKYASYATIYILMVLAIVVVANVLASRYEKTYDTTANKRYSLSSETKKIVSELKQSATITYFNQSGHFRQGKPLLDEYADLSSKIHVVYVDPDKDPNVARADGIRNLNTATVQGGAHTETAGDMTVEGSIGARSLDVKGSTGTFGVVTGSGEHQIDDNTLRIHGLQTPEKLFKIRRVGFAIGKHTRAVGRAAEHGHSQMRELVLHRLRKLGVEFRLR